MEDKYKHLSDEKLMVLFTQKKSSLIFTVIYKRYFKALYKYLFWLTHDMESAKDIAQVVFIKVYEKPELFDVSKSFKVWLFSIANNNWKNYLRKQSNQRKLLKKVGGFELPSVIIDDEVDDDNRMKEVKKVIEYLSDDHKEVVVLKYSENLTIKEIAQVLNCSEGTIKSRLFYALKKIQKNIKNGNESFTRRIV